MSKGKRWEVFDATTSPSDLDLAFAAGFLEGDGYFGLNKTTVSVEFNQKDGEMPQRFLEWFGGSLGLIHKQGISNGTYFRWRACGDRARNLMKDIYKYMSDRRKIQILKCIPEFDTEEEKY